VKNTGRDHIYVFVYNLGPSWQIENILRSSFEVIPGWMGDGVSRMMTKKMKTEVPANKKKERSCKDIIQVFVTSQPTTFDLLELPKLGSTVERAEGRGIPQLGHRGGSENWMAFNFNILTYAT
jgi:hypothetical protein